MPVHSARGKAVVLTLARAGLRLSLAAAFMLAAADALQNAAAEGDTRTISFHHAHTGEDITITFKRNGRYDEDALKKLDWFMRDWRKQQSTHMDPHLYDLLWAVHREVGATQPIVVICGYRSPGTNAMLRARSSGVAQFSQHTLGHAIDFSIPGVPLASIRAVGLQLQRGGVGFYPSSGSPFVHMDTGTVRHWPSISREQLVKIFPDGRTVHVPADGHPLPGYKFALAEVEKHGNAPNARSLEAARAAGMISEHEEQSASLVAAQRWQRVDLADAGDIEVPAQKQARAPVRLASLAAPKTVETRRMVPMPPARPGAAIAQATPSRQVVVASADIFKQAGIWPRVPPMSTSTGQDSAFELASLEPAVTSSTKVMAYAGEPAPMPRPAPVKARPMGAQLAAPQPVRPASAAITHAVLPNTTVVAKSGQTMTLGGQDMGSPWMRAVMLTPSVTNFLTMTRQGAVDPRWLAGLMHKPQQSLAMTFGDNPQGGLVTAQFTGSAVVFLATTHFGEFKTAALR